MSFLKTRLKPDPIVVFCALFLPLFGLVMLSSASSDLGEKKFNDTYFYVKHQAAFGLSLGAIFFAAAYFASYKILKKFAFLIIFLNILLLIFIFTPLGIGAKGAERWIKIGPAIFQPSEILKFSFIVYFASWLSSVKNMEFGRILAFLLISLAVVALLLLQPSTSTIVIIALASSAVLFVNGVKIRYLLAVVAVSLAALFLISYFSPYRWERIMDFFGSVNDVSGSGFQLNQALIAMGAGGPWGTGYGKSTTKYSYLPEPIGDSIFPVIAEELGFVGAASLIAVFAFLVVRGFMIAGRVRDQFGKLLATGITAAIFAQTFIHIAANSGLLPLTGVPLPFISYGGTSLAVFLGSLGVLANISKYA